MFLNSNYLLLHNINYNIHLLLQLRVETRIIYIRRALHTGSRNENNIQKFDILKPEGYFVTVTTMYTFHQVDPFTTEMFIYIHVH